MRAVSAKHDPVHSSRTTLWLHCRAMAVPYYASFLVEDPDCEDFRHISGVLELPKPLACSADDGHVRALLARGMNVCSDLIQLVCWSPLH